MQKFHMTFKCFSAGFLLNAPATDHAMQNFTKFQEHDYGRFFNSASAVVFENWESIG